MKSAKQTAQHKLALSGATIAHLIVIEGGAPPEKVWTEAEIYRHALRTMTPNIKKLPFVKNKPNAEPGWMPLSHWNVDPHYPRSVAKRYKLGASYAVEAVAAMKADGRNVLALIFLDMIQAGLKARKRNYDFVASGFMHKLAELLLPIQGDNA